MNFKRLGSFVCVALVAAALVVPRPAHSYTILGGLGGSGGGDTGPHGSGLPPAGVAPGAGGGGGMADALAAALQKRKEKVSRSGELFFFFFFFSTFALFWGVVCVMDANAGCFADDEDDNDDW